MRSLIAAFAAVALTLPVTARTTAKPAHPTPSTLQTQMMVRLSEIEIVPEHLDEYLTILKKESAASMRLEPGVISIFPMTQQENPAQVRILEIYANHDAYESHLKSPHFLEYKASTLQMVKSLKLVDMRALDPERMTAVFRKMP